LIDEQGERSAALLVPSPVAEKTIKVQVMQKYHKALARWWLACGGTMDGREGLV
jgi:hypothetical protein